jgi:hypothetical protein
MFIAVIQRSFRMIFRKLPPSSGNQPLPKEECKMTINLTRISLAALAVLTLSTSFASAGGGNGGIVNMPIVNVPIINNNGSGGNGNFGPGIIDLDPPSFDPAPKPPVIKIIDIWGPKNAPKSDTSKPSEGLPDIGCKVKDVGAATDDFWIINTGDVTLPMGLKVRYRVPSTGDHGAFELPRDLAVGQKLKISNLLNDAAPGAPCSVRIIA